jgi:hypothetical protein
MLNSTCTLVPYMLQPTAGLSNVRMQLQPERFMEASRCQPCVACCGWEAKRVGSLLLTAAGSACATTVQPHSYSFGDRAFAGAVRATFQPRACNASLCVLTVCVPVPPCLHCGHVLAAMRVGRPVVCSCNLPQSSETLQVCKCGLAKLGQYSSWSQTPGTLIVCCLDDMPN